MQKIRWLPLLFLVLVGGMAAGAASIPSKQLSLTEAQALALENSPKTKGAAAKLKAAAASLQEAKAANLPQVSAGGTYTRLSEGPPDYSAFPIIREGSPNNYTFRLNLQQPLYPGINLGVRPRLVESQLRQAQLEVERVRSEVEYEVETAFYNVLTAQAMVDLAEKAVAQAEAHLKQAEAFFAAGTALRTDVLRADLAKGQAEQNLLKARHGLKLAQLNFANALGVELDAVELVAPAAPLTYLQLDFAPFWELARKQRPELRNLDEARLQAELGVELAKSGQRPILAVNGTYGWQGAELQWDNSSWNLTLSATIPLFDGGQTKARITQARSMLEQVELGRQQLIAGLKLELEAALLAVAQAQESLPLAAKVQAQAAATLRIAQARYHGEVGTLTELLDAQTAASQAEGQYVQARYELAKARAQLKLALGGQIPSQFEYPIQEGEQNHE